jgi:hypothetical protein
MTVTPGAAAGKLDTTRILQPRMPTTNKGAIFCQKSGAPEFRDTSKSIDTIFCCALLRKFKPAMKAR